MESGVWYGLVPNVWMYSLRVCCSSYLLGYLFMDAHVIMFDNLFEGLHGGKDLLGVWG